MAIEFKIDQDRFSLDDLVEIESGMSNAKMKKFLAHLAVTADGKFIAEPIVEENEIVGWQNEDEALKRVGRLNLTGLKSAFEKVKRSVEQMKSSAVNPTTGDAS